jgi:magnesium transporter
MMVRISDSAALKAGMPPGSLIHISKSAAVATQITVIDYGLHDFSERQVGGLEDILASREQETVTWVNVEGLENTALIEDLGRVFGIHRLVQEDILNTHQRPKFEEYDEHLYLVLKAMLVHGDAGGFGIDYEQISILIMERMVFTFKERPDQLFAQVIQRLQNSKGFFRSQGTDYLAYTLLDAIIDEYFGVQDALDEIVENLEDELLTEPDSATLATIQSLKREMISIRRSLAPVRELLAGMIRSESPLIHEKTRVYLRDVYDHSIRVIEAMDAYRDLIAGMLDIYLSSISNRMNEVMKVLTVFATIFIPLTFIAGVYGMNFEYMPELKWKWSYPILWCFFIIVTTGLLAYFKRKKWL